MIEIEYIFNEKGNQNLNLFETLKEILNTDYIDCNSLLNRELNHCKHVYLGILNQHIICFFMVQWEEFAISKSIKNSVYLGLSAIKDEFKNSGYIKYVYDAFIKDAINWEKENDKKLILWATTATPTAYLVARKLFSKINPELNGTYSDEASDIAKEIQKKYNQNNNSNSFLLLNVAENTRYAILESERITKIMKIKKFELFSKFGVIEQNGDRLILVI